MVKSSKIFIVLLILSIALLTFLGSNSYKQIREQEKTAELVVFTLRVETEINTLFSRYAMMQSQVLKNKLQDKVNHTILLNRQKDSALTTFNRLKILTKDKPNQQKKLQELSTIQNSFYKALDQLNAYKTDTTLEEKNDAILLHNASVLMDEIEAIKTTMLANAEHYLAEQQEQFSTSRLITPITTLFLGMSALVIFLVSFWQINKQRKKNNRTTAFLESVLKNTENIVSYYTPVKNEANKIIDFKIDYINHNIENVLGTKVNEMKGKLLSAILPIQFKNGVFEILVDCYETGKNQKFKRNHIFNGTDYRFKTNVVKLNKGVLATASDITEEHIIKKNLTVTKDQLEAQNLLLLDNRAFLSNVFKSTSNIVTHFKSIRNDKGYIIDFEILFINDALNEGIKNNIPSELKYKRATEIYPNIFKNGVFEKMVSCIEESRQIEYETKINRNGKEIWLHDTAIKLNDGVTVTSRDITLEKTRAEKLNALYTEIEIQNSIFKDAEEVADIGSYVWYLDTGAAVISDNFYRILGYEPNAFEVTFDNYRRFVHPDDLKRYDKFGKEMVEKGSSNIHTYRIITKSGTIKHIYVNGQNIIKDGRNTSVGVVQDITDSVKTEEKLKAKNEELKRSNAELESFNRVASHDLQEPMRKIQMFISRLSEGELEKLSDRGKMYFSKIDSSANRMQTLIKYLLAYSRINRTKKDFVKVELNNTLNKVLDDLEELVNESGVAITVANLPAVKAIPFQMEQLFNNLVNNAIKYKSTTESPTIAIDCKKIPRTKIKENFDKRRKNYYQITVKDNGIGFDQENAKKIFGLFERLHQKEQYSGTGIGLAICKKIVVNHRGHITAKSKQGKGSTFCIYLPV